LKSAILFFDQDILLYIHNFLSPDDVDLIIYLFFMANTALIIFMIMCRAVPNFSKKNTNRSVQNCALKSVSLFVVYLP